MDNKTRIIRMAKGLPIDRAPWFCNFGPWWETEQRWKTEGLGPNRKWWEPFDFDAGFRQIEVNLGYFPAFQHETITDEGDTLIVRDSLGIIQRVMKHSSTIPQYLEYPVHDRESWLKLKERLDPESPGRFPENWTALAKSYQTGDALNQIGAFPYGLFGTLRDMFGVEELLVGFYDFPELIHEIMDYLTDFWIAIWEKAAKTVHIDIVHMWEDMSGVSGSLISPDMVRKFMCPGYQKMKQFCDRHDIPIFSLDTDGNCDQLIPPFMESGVNLLYPFEVQAGSDVNQILHKYPTLVCLGGIDKRALAISTGAIDAELERIRPAISTGRYIPQLDHLMHPEIPWDLFVYFYDKLKEICWSTPIIKG